MEVEQKQDEFFMNKAIEQAKIALERGEVPIGAIIVENGRVLGRGHNLVESLRDATAHAEMQAITSASSSVGGKYLPKSTLYVTVEPCIMCAGAIAWTQIGRVVYGASDPKKGYSTINQRILHPKTEVLSGVLEAECAELMQDFFKKLRM